MATNEERVWKVIREYIAEQIRAGNCKNKGTIGAETRVIEDLGLDCFHMIDIVISTEEEFTSEFGNEWMLPDIKGDGRGYFGIPEGKIHFEKKNGEQIPFETLGEFVRAVCSLMPSAQEVANG